MVISQLNHHVQSSELSILYPNDDIQQIYNMPVHNHAGAIGHILPIVIRHGGNNLGHDGEKQVWMS